MVEKAGTELQFRFLCGASAAGGTVVAAEAVPVCPSQKTFSVLRPLFKSV
jgi:hypothetical protein